MITNKLYISQKDLTIEIEDLLADINLQEDDIVFLGGSLIEGLVNPLSRNMVNKYSDIDIFILSSDFSNVVDVVYDQKYVKTVFKQMKNCHVDIEIFDLKVMGNLMRAFNKVDFEKDERIYNILEIPKDFTLNVLTSFMHRFLNSIPIFNEEKYINLKNSINFKSYFEFMKRVYLNNADNDIEDIVGNLDAGEYEVSLVASRNVLKQTIGAYIFHKSESFDRDKWMPLKLKNMANENQEVNSVYLQYKEFMFERGVSAQSEMKQLVEEMLSYVNTLFDEICEGGL